MKSKYIFHYNPTYRLHFTHEIYIQNSYITIDYTFPSQHYCYVVSSFQNYWYVNNLSITSKDNKKQANQRILSRYLTEKCKIWGLGRYFTPSSKGKKCPSSDSESCTKGRYFWQIQWIGDIKMSTRAAQCAVFLTRECRLSLYTHKWNTTDINFRNRLIHKQFRTITYSSKQLN